MNLNDLKNFFCLCGNSFVPNVGIGTTSPAASLDVTGTGTANVKVEVRGANGQTANLMNWRDYAGSIIAYITGAGNFAATGRVIILGTDATDGGACSPAGSIARDANGDLFICK